MTELNYDEAAAMDRSLRRKSRSIYIIAMAVLFWGYMKEFGLMIAWMFSSIAPEGTGLSSLIGITAAAVPFLIPALLLYFPAAAALMRFLDKRNAKGKRISFLAITLVPYIICLSLSFGWMYFFYTLPRQIAYATAEAKSAEYKQMYDENAELLNRINDTLLSWEGKEDSWWLYVIHKWGEYDDEISVGLSGEYYPDYGYTYPPLEIVKELSDEDKQNIQALFDGMNIKKSNIHFHRNCFEWDINGAEIQFIKPEGFRDYSVDGEPLGDGWYFCIGYQSLDFNQPYRDYVSD